MKKTWTAPEILSEDLTATQFNASQGEVVDGQYKDWITCDPVDVYLS